VLKGTSIGENLRDIRRRVLREWSRRTKAAGSGGGHWLDVRRARSQLRQRTKSNHAILI
jgi:hypothetical protein